MRYDYSTTPAREDLGRTFRELHELINLQSGVEPKTKYDLSHRILKPIDISSS